MAAGKCVNEPGASPDTAAARPSTSPASLQHRPRPADWEAASPAPQHWLREARRPRSGRLEAKSRSPAGVLRSDFEPLLPPKHLRGERPGGRRAINFTRFRGDSARTGARGSSAGDTQKHDADRPTTRALGASGQRIAELYRACDANTRALLALVHEQADVMQQGVGERFELAVIKALAGVDEVLRAFVPKPGARARSSSPDDLGGNWRRDAGELGRVGVAGDASKPVPHAASPVGDKVSASESVGAAREALSGTWCTAPTEVVLGHSEHTRAHKPARDEVEMLTRVSSAESPQARPPSAGAALSPPAVGRLTSVAEQLSVEAEHSGHDASTSFCELGGEEQALVARRALLAAALQHADTRVQQADFSLQGLQFRLSAAAHAGVCSADELQTLAGCVDEVRREHGHLALELQQGLQEEHARAQRLAAQKREWAMERYALEGRMKVLERERTALADWKQAHASKFSMAEIKLLQATSRAKQLENHIAAHENDITQCTKDVSAKLEAEIDKWRNYGYHELATKAARLEQENSDLMLAAGGHRKRIQHLTDELEHLGRLAEPVLSREAELRKQVKQAKIKQTCIEELRRAQDVEIERLNAELNRAAERHAEVLSRVCSCEKRLENSELAGVKARKEFEGLLTEASKRAQRLEQRKQELERQLQSERVKLAELASSLAQAEVECKAAALAKDDVLDDMMTLQNQLAELRAAAHVAEDQSRCAKAECTLLKQRNGALSKDLTDLRVAHETATKQRDAHELTVARLEKQLAAADETIRLDTSKIAHLSTMLVSFNRAIAQQKDAFQSVEQQRDRSQADLAELTDAVGAAKGDMAHALQRSGLPAPGRLPLGDVTKTLVDAFDDAMHQNRAHSDAIADYGKELADARAVTESLKAEVSDLEALVAALSSSNEKLHSEVTALGRRASALNETVTFETNEKEKAQARAAALEHIREQLQEALARSQDADTVTSAALDGVTASAVKLLCEAANERDRLAALHSHSLDLLKQCRRAIVEAIGEELILCSYEAVDPSVLLRLDTAAQGSAVSSFSADAAVSSIEGALEADRAASALQTKEDVAAALKAAQGLREALGRHLSQAHAVEQTMASQLDTHAQNAHELRNAIQSANDVLAQRLADLPISGQYLLGMVAANRRLADQLEADRVAASLRTTYWKERAVSDGSDVASTSRDGETGAVSMEASNDPPSSQLDEAAVAADGAAASALGAPPVSATQGGTGAQAAQPLVPQPPVASGEAARDVVAVQSQDGEGVGPTSFVALSPEPSELCELRRRALDLECELKGLKAAQQGDVEQWQGEARKLQAALDRARSDRDKMLAKCDQAVQHRMLVEAYCKDLVKKLRLQQDAIRRAEAASGNRLETDERATQTSKVDMYSGEWRRFVGDSDEAAAESDLRDVVRVLVDSLLSLPRQVLCSLPPAVLAVLSAEGAVVDDRIDGADAGGSPRRPLVRLDSAHPAARQSASRRDRTRQLSRATSSLALVVGARPAPAPIQTETASASPRSTSPTTSRLLAAVLSASDARNLSPPTVARAGALAENPQEGGALEQGGRDAFQRARRKPSLRDSRGSEQDAAVRRPASPTSRWSHAASAARRAARTAAAATAAPNQSIVPTTDLRGQSGAPRNARTSSVDNNDDPASADGSLAPASLAAGSDDVTQAPERPSGEGARDVDSPGGLGPHGRQGSRLRVTLGVDAGDAQVSSERVPEAASMAASAGSGDGQDVTMSLRTRAALVQDALATLGDAEPRTLAVSR